METLEKSAALQSRLLKQKRLAFQVKIEGNATPANKKRSSDLPGVVIVLCEGQTSEKPVTSPAISSGTPDDSDGVFSVILDKAAIGSVEKVLKAEIVDITGTSVIASASVSEDHIVVVVDSNVNLAGANNCECRLIIDYLKK
jgi:hypothetical protein